jgi:hypothetical protein
MPDIDCLLWTTGATLLKKWSFAGVFDLAMAILYEDLPAFDPISRQFIHPSLHSDWLIKDGIVAKDFIEKLRFRESDVRKFESKHLSDHKSMEVEPMADDRENVYRKTLEKIIEGAEHLDCEHCITMEFARRGLVDLKKMGPSKNESQELGRLRREKEKWNLSIEAAVKSAIHFSREAKKSVTRAELLDFVYKEVNKTVTSTSIDKIWKAFPDDLKKDAGRPKKKKKPQKYSN